MKLPRHAELWLPGYLKSRARRFLDRARGPAPRRLYVALTDHYEPMGGKVSLQQGLARVAHWQRRWPEIAASAPKDSEGRQPCFSLFYPEEEYEREILREMEPMTRAGFTDVEVHLHHDHDTAENFLRRISQFCRTLHEQHGFLRMRDGALTFGFIHGNWALDNSRPDGRWCGVTGELQLLRQLGCYADFTMPSLPSPTQSRIVNQIYWTQGDPTQPRGFDRGEPAVAGGGRRGDMLMVTGPLGLRFSGRLLPRLETGELAAYDPPTAQRVERWIDLSPRIGDSIFVKLYGHTAREDNAAALLGQGANEGAIAPMFRWFHESAARRGLELHWVSAFRMYEAIERLTHGAVSSAKGAQG